MGTIVSILLGALVVVLVDIFVFNRTRADTITMSCTVGFRPGDSVTIYGEEGFYEIGKITATTITLNKPSLWRRFLRFFNG